MPAEATIAKLPAIPQVAFGWTDAHLHRFLLHSREYSIAYLDRPGFRNDAQEIRLSGFDFRIDKRFVPTTTSPTADGTNFASSTSARPRSTGHPGPDTPGLRLAEVKDLLATVQDTLVDAQITAAVAVQVSCPHCGRPRRHKDQHTIVVPSLLRAAAVSSYCSPPARPGRS